MLVKTTLAAGAALLTTLVSAHGNVTFPPARLPGAATIAACGQEAVNALLADATAPIENIPAVGCDRFLCKGVQFEDNLNGVQIFAAGEIVNFQVILPIPHEGPANVSVVDTATNLVIGRPLISFGTYADERLAVLPRNNTDFNVTIPDTIGEQCAEAGACVLQWFWFGTGAKQSYESCIDFVIVPS